MSFGNSMIVVADQIGSPANAKNGAWDELVDSWFKDMGERLPCIEMGQLAKALVSWVIKGDLTTPGDVFAALEPIIADNRERDDGILSGFVGPCLMEGIDGELADYETWDASRNFRRQVFELMGPVTQSYWTDTLGFRG